MSAHALDAAAHALFVAWGEGGDEEPEGSDLLHSHAAAVIRAYLDALDNEPQRREVASQTEFIAGTRAVAAVIKAVRP